MTTQAKIQVEGRRVWVELPYGHLAVSKLKAIGFRWDPESKRWWAGSAKQDKAKAIVEESESASDEEKTASIEVVGKARYKGRVYYVEWHGSTRRGMAAKLVSLDGSLRFWASLDESPDKEVAEIIKRFAQPTRLGSIRKFVDGIKKGTVERFDPNCQECRALKKMCERCRFDD